MDRKKTLLVVLALALTSVGLRAFWPWLVQFEASGGVSRLGLSTIESDMVRPQLTELRLADLELEAAEYHPGRDPFRYRVKPPPAPKPPPPAQKAPAKQVRRVKANPRPNGGRPAAPTPPPVDVKYLGSFGPASGKIAVFGDGTDIYNVRKGDILKEHFVVENINYESADLKFVNFPKLPATRLAAGE